MPFSSAEFRKYKSAYLQSKFEFTLASRPFKLLPFYCPILWLSMVSLERNRCTCWRLEQLPEGTTRLCYYQTYPLTKQHVIHRLCMHRRLHVSYSVSNPVSHLLNKLSKALLKRAYTKNYWSLTWNSFTCLLSGLMPFNTLPLLPMVIQVLLL